MPDEKRIKDFEPATEILNDDWFAIDSPSAGTRKVQLAQMLEAIQTQVTAIADELGVLDGEVDAHDTSISNLQTKVGTATLTTEAPDLSGAVNELNSSIIQYRMVQMNITAQTVNPQGGATLLNGVDFTTSTMIDTFSNQTLAQLFSGKTILGAHFMWTNGSGSASVSEFVDNNKVTIGVMNVSSVQLAYSAVRVAVWYR